MIKCLHCFWAMVRQNIMVEGCSGAKLLTSWQPGSGELEKGRVWGLNKPF
jgi:hypothetical protein